MQRDVVHSTTTTTTVNTTIEQQAVLHRLRDVRCDLANFYVLDSQPDSALVLSTFIVVAVNGLLAFCGVVLNASVIAAYMKNKRLRTTSNMLLFVLACSDLLVSAVAQPTFIIKKFAILASRFDCVLWTANRLLFYGTCGLSLSVVSILSVERLITLRFPYHYQSMITRTRLKVAVAIVVLILLLLFNSQALKPAYEILAVIGAIIIFLNVTLVVSIWIWIQRLIRRHESSIKSIHVSLRNGAPHLHIDSTNSTNNCSSNTRVLRSTRTSYLIVGGVLLCYFPIFVGHVYFSVKPNDYDFFFYVTPWIDTLALGNSVLNPAILFKRKRNFRKTVKLFFGVTNDNISSSE